MQNSKNNYEIEFENYISNFDINNPRIKLKIFHMYEVKKIAKTVAYMLCLPKKDVELAEFLGLYHDIGRFEQVKQYGTFYDEKSIDHAAFGAQILEKDGLIKKMYPGLSDEDYEILLCAIKYHNKFKLTKDMPHSNHYLCRIIRDADKIDIYRSMSDEEFQNLFFDFDKENSVISEEVKKTFYSNLAIPKALVKTRADNLVMKIAFVFDFNYNVSKDLLLRYGYLGDFVQAFLSAKTVKNTEISTQIMEMYEYANDFLRSN